MHNTKSRIFPKQKKLSEITNACRLICLASHSKKFMLSFFGSRIIALSSKMGFFVVMTGDFIFTK